MEKSERRRSLRESVEVNSRKKKKLEIIPSDCPKYYLTISEKDIECSRKSLGRKKGSETLNR